MNPELLKTVIDRQFSEWMKVSTHTMATGEEVCRVILPLWEPNGDVVTAYVSEVSGRTVIHDGGHISGLLFESGPRGPRKHDRDLVDRLLSDAGLQRDMDTGMVRVETTEDGLRYWLMEFGRVIALVPELISVISPAGSGAGPARTRGRTARAVRNRLVNAGFSKGINPPLKVRGVSNRTHTVDLSYPVYSPQLEFGESRSMRTVHVMAVDLDVAKPLEKADKSIGIANDLVWATSEDGPIDVTMVYGFGTEKGVSEPAARLLATAGEKSSFSSYSWDNSEDQASFLARVGQELAAP